MRRLADPFECDECGEPVPAPDVDSHAYTSPEPLVCDSCKRRVVPADKTAHLLSLLAHMGESYGLALVERAAEKGGTVRRGEVYVLLGRLEDQGLVASREEAVTPPHIGIPRRLYWLTREGHIQAAARSASGNDETSRRARPSSATAVIVSPKSGSRNTE